MHKTYEELMKNNPSVVIWGTGKIMRKYISKIDPGLKISFFADTYQHKWETYPAKEIDCKYSDILCKSKDEIQFNDVVFIAIEAERDIKIVSAELDKKGINYCHIIEAVHAYRPIYEAKQLDRYEKCNNNSEQQFDNKKLKKYITCHVPYSYCNLRCSYCYITQIKDFIYKKNFFHSPKFIRAALSKKRLGGVALINFCAAGETLMCSELKRLNLLDVFTSNVRRMRSAGCSISIEVTPSDELIPYIDEIKSFSVQEFGAYPHFTVARDDTSDDVRILTEHNMEEYKNVWGTFDSALFEFKMAQVSIKRFEDCKAGELSAHMNLETGDLFKCIGNPYLDNIYDDICKDIKFEAVGNKCKLPYCWNCHSYLALGVIDEFKAPTYYDVRDRKTTNGEHWVHGKMEHIFKQRLYENNK